MVHIKIANFCGLLCGIWILILIIAVAIPEDSRLYMFFIELDAYFTIVCFGLVPIGICLIQKHNREEQFRAATVPSENKERLVPIAQPNSSFNLEPQVQTDNQSERTSISSKIHIQEQPIQKGSEEYICPSCGTVNTPNAQFCFACGERLK